MDSSSYELFLSRPFSILGASLWNFWYQSDAFENLTGFRIYQGKFLGTPAIGGENKQEFLVRCFRKKVDLKQMRAVFVEIIEKTPFRALELLRTAESIFQKESRFLEEIHNKNTNSNLGINSKINFGNIFENPEEALSRYATIGIYTGLLPFLFIGQCSSEDEALRNEIQQLCEALRGKTLYPKFFEEAMLPYFTAVSGLKSEQANFYTYKELLEKSSAYTANEKINTEEIPEQIQLRSTQNFEYITDIDTESFISIGKEEIVPTELKGKIFKGTVVSLGDGKPVIGTARVVTGTDISGIEFNQGDILVTIHSSPIYMPLIRKAGALLSEEGGVACHTSVIARSGPELNKITLMGLSGLLESICDNDRIEVDPNLSQVKII